jgi:hypothetical protein
MITRNCIVYNEHTSASDGFTDEHSINNFAVVMKNPSSGKSNIIKKPLMNVLQTHNITSRLPGNSESLIIRISSRMLRLLY